MNKTIVIGVGGTGLEAIRALRKLIVENHKGLDVKEMRNLGFLYIDTDGTNVVISKDNKSKWEYLGQSIALNVNEYVIVSGPDVASIINDIDSYPHIKEWLPKEDLANINKTKEKVGASQARPLGRFILTMSSEEVGAAFKQVFKRVPPPEQGGKTHVYVICSLSGGTGSGMFLDLAYKIRYWTDGGCKIFGFLVLPENPTSRGRRYLVNAYAALLELNYLSLASEQGKKKGTDSAKTIKFRLPGESKPVEGAPFDVCCIVGTKNDEGIELDINAIPAMIAHRIYLNFDSEFGAASARLLDNTETERGLMLDDAYTGNRHSRNFYTFGLSSIQYPIEQFLDVLSFRLSKALIDQWHREKDYPGDVNTRVLNNLSLLKLTDDYLLGDKDFFGSKHFEGFEVEVDTLVNSLKQTFPKHNIAPYLDTQLNQKISGFRGTGIADYYKNKRNTEDFNGALNEVRKLIRKQVSDDVINSDLGYEYCRKVLDELANILKEKQKLFVDKFNGLPAQEKNSRVSYNNFLNELTKIEGQTMPFGKDKKLRDCVNKIGEAMKSNLGAKIGLKAYELGIAFTKNVIDDIDVHKDNLKAWRDSVEKLKNDLASEVTKRITEVEKKIANVKEFNGSLLFSSSKIDDFYKALDLKSAVSYIEKEALASVGGGALDFRPTSNTIDSLYKIAVSWLQNISTYRISETNVADKLIEDYNDAYHRRALISSNFKKSCPFIQVSKAEISKGFKNDSYSLVEGTTNARIVGILNPEKVTSTDSLNTVIDDITDATGIRPPEWITDKHQILFLTEYSAFPLRIIREVASLREKYEDYFRQEEKPIPVHIAKSFDPPLMDLFLTTLCANISETLPIR